MSFIPENIRLGCGWGNEEGGIEDCHTGVNEERSKELGRTGSEIVDRVRTEFPTEKRDGFLGVRIS